VAEGPVIRFGESQSQSRSQSRGLARYVEVGLVGLVGLLALSLHGCGASESGDSEGADAPIALADQEDAVCGMLVREQSAPRSQIVHNDGSRFFFCSIGDMLIHLGAPSPHGRAKSVFVEVMDPREDPARPHTGAHPWAAAEDVVYVVGIERPGVMGAPVLTYADGSAAEQVIAQHTAAQALDIDGLRLWWDARESAR
jgi:nitrous oxide reductase accessory protein NosL